MKKLVVVALLFVGWKAIPHDSCQPSNWAFNQVRVGDTIAHVQDLTGGCDAIMRARTATETLLVIGDERPNPFGIVVDNATLHVIARVKSNGEVVQ